MKSYIIPENMLNGVILHIAHSVPRHATVEESVQLAEALKRLPEHQVAKEENESNKQ